MSFIFLLNFNLIFSQAFKIKQFFAHRMTMFHLWAVIRWYLIGGKYLVKLESGDLT